MSNPFVISMKFTSDPSGATAATGQLRQEIGQLGAALDQSRTKAVQLQAALETRASSSAATGAYQSTLTLIRAEQQLEAQRLSAQISESGRAQSLNRLAQLARDGAAAAQGLARAESEAASAEQRMGQAASEASIAVGRLADQQQRVAALRSTGINSTIGVRDDFDTGTRGADVAAYGEQLDALRARYNPLFAAEQRREVSLASIRQAHRLGAISATEMAAAIRTEEAAFARSVSAISGSTEALQRNQAARTMGRSDGGGQFATANIAAQFQDIAVTSAMGMSPLQIALQQGTQISAVFGNMGAAGAVRTLGAAFMSVISPVSLLTIGLVAGTAAAIQYFSGLGSGAEDADKRLDDHLERIQKMARGYDEATQAAEDYIEESRKQPEGSLVSNLGADQQRALDGVRTAVESITAKSAQIANDLTNLRFGGELFADIIQAADGLDNLGISADSTAAEVAALHTRLTVLVNDQSAPEQARQYAADLLALVESLRTANAEVGSLGATLENMPKDIKVFLRLQVEGFSEAMSSLQDVVPDQRSRFDIMRAENDNAAQQATTRATSYGALNLAVGQYEKNLATINTMEAEHNARIAEKGAKQVSAYDRQIESIRERTEAQAVETNIIGLGTYASERARVSLELETAARKDAIGLTPERIAQIEAEASAYATAAAAQEKLVEKQRASTEQYNFAKSTFRSFFSDLKAGLREGQDGWDALGNAGASALDRIADRALGMAADGIFDMIFSAISGAIGGGWGGNPLSLGPGGPGFLGGGAAAWGSLGSFDTGGWTGGSDRSRIAGVVHEEEFVVRAGPAGTHRALLEQLNAGGSPTSTGGAVTLAPVYNYYGASFTEAQARRMQQDNNRELMAQLPGALADANRRAVKS